VHRVSWFLALAMVACGDAPTLPPDAGADPPDAGATCRRDGDCQDGFRCLDQLCVVDDRECVEDGDCGAEAVCVEDACLDRVAEYGACVDDAQCPDGSACRSGLEATTICSRDCDSTADCTDGVCALFVDDDMVARGVCVEAEGATLGEACEADADCAGRVCRSGLCAEICTNPTDCVTGTECLFNPVEGAFGDPRVCAPPNPAGEIQDVTLIDDVGLDAGTGRALEVLLPADASSVTFLAERTDGDEVGVLFFELTAPDGTALYDFDTLNRDFVDTPVRWLGRASAESAAMLVPNSPRVPFVPGLYRLTIAAGSGTGRGRYRVRARLRRSPVPVDAVLDLRVHLVGLTVDAAGAPENPRIGLFLEAFEEIVGTAGLRVGGVSYVDIGGAAAERLAVIDSTDGRDSELADLFRLGGPAGDVLDVFLVRALMGGDDGFLQLGVAGGIPGPPGVHGVSEGGVVLSFESALTGTDGDARRAGRVLAHEVGHFLGLFHNTEQAEPCGAEETPPGCAPYGGGDVLEDTDYGDRANLMFWRVTSMGPELSAEQGAVLRSSALVRTATP
jgi:hypothetical protein